QNLAGGGLGLIESPGLEEGEREIGAGEKNIGSAIGRGAEDVDRLLVRFDGLFPTPKRVKRTGENVPGIAEDLGAVGGVDGIARIAADLARDVAGATRDADGALELVLVLEEDGQVRKAAAYLAEPARRDALDGGESLIAA